MMAGWTGDSILRVTQGKSLAARNWTASHFTTDSREVKPGSVFIALRGETVDGHDFVETAFALGAVAAIVERPLKLSQDFSLVCVRSTKEAIVALGRQARADFKGTVIGITGSAGKTSTKEMLLGCLQKQVLVEASQKSFNTLVGVVTALLNCPEETQYLILEMGMDRLGEIHEIVKVAAPDVVAITTVGAAHLGCLKDIQGVAQAKSEIFLGIPAPRFAIVPSGLGTTDFLKKQAEKNGVQNCLTFGEQKDADSFILKYVPDEKGGQVDANILGEIISYRLKTYGKHHVLNSVLVLTLIKVLHLSLKDAVNKISFFSEPHRRGQATVLDQGILLVDETFNANPESMRRALEGFFERPCYNKRIIVLGDMLDLGEKSHDYHAQLKETLIQHHPDAIILYGEHMKSLERVLAGHPHVQHFMCKKELIAFLKHIIRPKDNLFIKSSKGTKLDEIVQVMKESNAV